MKPLQFMLIAGEASGDTLGAELISALKTQLGGREAKFFGVGGPRMQAAGLELIFDFTHNAVWGLEVFKHILEFRRQFEALAQLAAERKPDVVIGVDFGGFNSRFAQAIKERALRSEGWRPKRVQFVSPQVWASRPWRARKLARNLDLLLTIFPFEKAWYARREPNLRVEFVGHPMVDRYGHVADGTEREVNEAPTVVFLPGSRRSELKRHLPVMRDVLQSIRLSVPKVRPVMVLPDHLADTAQQIGLPPEFTVRPNLAEELRQADLAIAKSGTVTLECAYFRVPTVVMYKTSAITYAIGIRLVQVKWAAMPNILANEEVFPEFLQNRATAANIAAGALELLGDAARRNKVKTKLAAIAATLGEPGAARRAAEKIIGLLEPQTAASSPEK